MRMFLAFLIGFQLGRWCTGPEAHDRGYKAGVWTREALGLVEPTP